MYQATHLFFYALRQQDIPLNQQPQMKQTLSSLLLENIGKDVLQEQGYADLTVTFVDPDSTPGMTTVVDVNSMSASTEQEDTKKGEKILENIPIVRIILKKNAKQV